MARKFDVDRVTVSSGAAIVANGSEVVDVGQCGSLTLIVNCLNAPTGVGPTLVYTLAEVDPGNQSTVVGASVTAAALTGARLSEELTLSPILSGTVLVSWVIAGAGASFTGVNATLETNAASSGSGSSATSTQQDANRVARTVHLASQALPAAGALVLPAVYAIPDHVKSICFFVTYGRGAAGGYPLHELLWGNGTEEGRELVIDSALAVSAPDAQRTAYTDIIRGPAPSAGGPFQYTIEALVPGGATTVRLGSAEGGVTGTPGTIAIALTAGSS